jgi:SAM-dependent methyltransferase
VSDKPPWETADREVFRATFDDDVDAYDRSRPVAPSYVFDEVVALAALTPGSDVVEIGPGTGQATRPLADRGVNVLALELGAGLAARARANLAAYDGVEVLNASFEAWDSGGRSFDAVFACNSFHWIDPDVRFVKAAGVLKPGGRLVVLATPWVVPDDADRFWWDVQDDYLAVGGARFDPSSMHPDRVGDLGPAIRRSGSFEEPTLRRYLFDVAFTADEYVTNLSTQSGIKAFDMRTRVELMERVRQRIVRLGGTVTAHLLAQLAVARASAT